MMFRNERRTRIVHPPAAGRRPTTETRAEYICPSIQISAAIANIAREGVAKLEIAPEARRLAVPMHQGYAQPA